MFDGTTLIVDVLTLGENSYALSLPAEDLWVAYEVVRRHVDANGVRHYSQMTEAKTTTDGYSFKFDTGDTFTCASHLDKPTSSTLSDETGGGSGGLPPVTASDAGKVLTAQASVTKGAVIVPEQTVELMGKTPVELTGVTSFPSDGDVVIVVQAQTDTAVTVSHGTIIINSQDEVYSEGGKYYCKSSQASNRGHTVTLTVYASVQSGVWGASSLYGSDRRIQIGAVKSNGVWTTSTQITPDQAFNGIYNGYDFQLYVNGVFSRMSLVLSDYFTYAVFEAFTQSQEHLLITMNGFGDEYVSISIEPFSTDFIVTLTPTAQDYSGTMDKTVAEIDAAYKAGREIWFEISDGYTTNRFALSEVYTDNSTYPSYNGFIIYNDMIIKAATGSTNLGTSNTYNTSIFPLTPAT